MGYYSPLTTTDLTTAIRNIKPFGYLEFWSPPGTNLSVSTSAEAKALPSVVLPDILSGETIKAAYAMFIYNTVLDSSAATNYTYGDTYIQVDKSSAGWTNAIMIKDQDIICSANQFKAGIVLVGSIDIKSKVAFNDTTTFQWAGADAQGNNLDFKGVRTGLRVFV